MPRYRYESPFERVCTGLSVGVDGTDVHPADGRPQPPDGSTVVLSFGDEITTAKPCDAYGLIPVDPPSSDPTPTSTEETAKP